MMSNFIATTGATIHVTDQGSGDVAFVFLHYWGGSARTWHHVIDGLASQARCVAIDFRGWGTSKAHDGRYDLNAMAQDVAEVIAALGLKRVILVGHSMGGKVAQIVACAQRVSPEALILVAPSPATGMQVPAEIRAQMFASYQTADGVAQALTILAHRPLDDADRAMVVEDTLAGADGAKREWTQHGMIARLQSDVAAITVPVHILVGDSDMVERVDDLRGIYATLLPHAVFEVLPATGHLSPLENPGAIVAACARQHAQRAALG
jgi:pimeloyl-ACP methyl ester carboxylesterase